MLSKKQLKQMEEAVKPLMKFLQENCHPHMCVIVDSTNGELLEGIAMIHKPLTKIPNEETESVYKRQVRLASERIKKWPRWLSRSSGSNAK